MGFHQTQSSGQIWQKYVQESQQVRMIGFVLNEEKYTGCTLQRNGCKLLEEKPRSLFTVHVTHIMSIFLSFFSSSPPSNANKSPSHPSALRKNPATTYPLKVPVNHMFQRVSRKIKYLFFVIEMNTK